MRHNQTRPKKTHDKSFKKTGVVHQKAKEHKFDLNGPALQESPEYIFEIGSGLTQQQFKDLSKDKEAYNRNMSIFGKTYSQAVQIIRDNRMKSGNAAKADVTSVKKDITWAVKNGRLAQKQVIDV